MEPMLLWRALLPDRSLKKGIRHGPVPTQSRINKAVVIGNASNIYSTCMQLDRKDIRKVLRADTLPESN